MPSPRCSRWCLSLLVASTLAAPLHEAARAASPFDPVLERVLKLLPKRPLEVAVIDPNQAQPDVRRTLLTLDAFITKGGRVVYLTSHSEVIQGALKGSQLCDYILATIVWHEMAHIDGANEAEAQRCEEQLWTAFLMEERVDRIQGLRYLKALKSRRGDEGHRRP
ncbi:MAG: hypothetical protein H0U94_12460 [Acidobacteria bacterium]|nr:hypothetical protein [Acidobacteriota bacterium]